MSNTITLNARGTQITLYKDFLLQIKYFNCLLGNEQWKSASPVDNAYFIDCDADVFLDIISYVEFGEFRKNTYSKSFLRKVMDKFGIEYEFEDLASDSELELYRYGERLKNLIQVMIDKEIYQFDILFCLSDKNRAKIVDQKELHIFHNAQINPIFHHFSRSTENTTKLFEEVIGDKFEINVNKNKSNSYNNVNAEDRLSVTLIPK